MKLKHLLNEVIDPESNEAKRLSKVSGGSIKVSPSGEYYSEYNLYIDKDHSSALYHEMISRVDGRGTLDFRLESVHGNFYVGDCDLMSFKNFPLQVTGNLDAWGNKFTSLDGITPLIGETLVLSHNDSLTTFAGVGKYIKKCTAIIVPGNLKERLLGVMLISNLGHIMTTEEEISPNQCPELSVVIDIINNHLNDSRNLIDAKEELMAFSKYNLKEFAKL
jgi:hypothetical protein